MLASLFPRGGTEFFDLFERHAAKTLEAAHLLKEHARQPEGRREGCGAHQVDRARGGSDHPPHDRDAAQDVPHADRPLRHPSSSAGSTTFSI